MNYTQFHGNTFLFINKNTDEFPLPKESKEVDLTMYYETIVMTYEDTRKQYTCDFVNKDDSKASLCCNAVLRLMEIEGEGDYVFHTISGLYNGWNNENEMGLLMPKAEIVKSNTDIQNVQARWFYVNTGNHHHIILHHKNDWRKVCNDMNTYEKIPEINTHIAKQKNTNTFQVRCFERGVGETQACGSGAYAVGVAMIKHFNLNEVKIIMKGGEYIVTNGLLIVKK